MSSDKKKKQGCRGMAGPATVLMLLAAGCVFADFMLQLYLTGQGYSDTYAKISWYNPLNAATDTALLLAPFLLLPARRRGWALAVMWVVSLWCLLTVLYSVTYDDIMPLKSFTYVSNVNTLVVESTLANLAARPLAALFVVMPAAVTLIYAFLLRKPLLASPAPWRPWLAVAAVALWGAWAMAYPYYLMVRYSPRLMIDRERGLAMANDRFKYKLGIFYQGAVRALASEVKTMFPQRLDGDARREVEQFLAHDLETDTISPLGGTNAGKNLVIVLVESLNAWAADIEIDGRLVAPTLHALCSPDSSLCSRRMLMQTCNGRSSDGMFCYMTGLLPLRTGSVVMDYPRGNYLSLPQGFKQCGGTAAAELTCGYESQWNLKVISQEYGFDTLVTMTHLRPLFEGDPKLVDKVAFEQASGLTSRLRQPFMMVVFNMATHMPYDRFPVSTWITRSSAYSPAVRVYLEKLHYFDEQLARFVDGMKQSGLWDNTVMLIVSDHTDAVDNDTEHGRPTLSAEGNECVFAVVNGGVTGEVPGYMGQIDVYPTILDVMGWRGRFGWQGLGHSVLRAPFGTAVAPDGKLYGTPLERDYTGQQRQAWDISETLITTGWFRP